MEPWLLVLISSFTSIVASSGFWAFLQRRLTMKSAHVHLLLGMAYDKIAHLGLGYIERGWISKDEFEDFEKYLYRPYKDLGGNGVGDRIMEEVLHLPLRSHNKYSGIIQQRKENGENHEHNVPEPHV